MVKSIHHTMLRPASFYGHRYKTSQTKKEISTFSKREEILQTDNSIRTSVFSLPFYTPIQLKDYKIKMPISFKASNSDVKSISFSKNLDGSEKIKALTKEYRVQLENNMPWFEARKGKILQPSEINEETLEMIAEKSLKDMEGIPENKILYIVSGRIGCGKTTFVRQKKFGEYCYIPDCDDIKPFLQGYKDKDSTYVHLASSSILAANLYEAFKKGLNVVFQTSTEERFLDTVLEKAKQCGYKKIVMFHINTSEENSITRANKRGLETGRFIKPDVIKSQKYIDDLVSIYQNPKKGLSELFVYDNNSKDFIEVEHFSLNDDNPA